MPSVLEIIRESEGEHDAPCRVGEWREAKLKSGEVPQVEQRIAKRKLPNGWLASVVVTNGKPMLRYTKQA